MSAKELWEHRGYLADQRRTDAYRAALAEVVEPADVVLDLGTGTGMLGYLACEAGAKSVLAVDRGDVVGLARRVAADNGYADRITYLQTMSTELQLDQPANVAVCDQIGGMVHDAGILVCYADARRRLLTPDARLVPASFRIYVAPVTFELGRSAVDFWTTRPSGVDVAAAHPMAVNTEWKYNVAVEDVVALASGRELAAFAADHEELITGSAQFNLSRDGRFDGFLGWFEAALSPSVTLTNDPWSPDRFDRWCNFYALERPLEVAAGDPVELRLDIRPRLEIVSWATTVTTADGRRHRFRQSTFQSSFLTAETVDAFARDKVVAPSARADLVRAVLDLIDGKRTESEIVAGLADRVGDGFASRNHLESFVRDVLALAR